MKFEKDFVAEQFQCDLNDCFPIGAILRQVQQVSNDHCEHMGMTAQTFAQSNTAFVLAKVSVECLRPIPAGQKLHIVTQPSWPVRAVYHRFTSLQDAQGQEFCSVDARWALIDIQQRRILRTPPESLHFPFLGEVERAHEVSITRAAELEPMGEYQASYSRTDRNGHLNNACYADCVCDALPLEQTAHRFLRKMVLYYHKELRLGESMELFRGQTGPDAWYICGKKEGSKCFEANAYFQ